MRRMHHDVADDRSPARSPSSADRRPGSSGAMPSGLAFTTSSKPAASAAATYEVMPVAATRAATSAARASVDVEDRHLATHRPRRARRRSPFRRRRRRRRAPAGRPGPGRACAGPRRARSRRRCRPSTRRPRRGGSRSPRPTSADALGQRRRRARARPPCGGSSRSGPRKLRSAFAPSRNAPSPDGADPASGRRRRRGRSAGRAPLHTSGERACAIGSPMIPRTRVAPVVVAGAAQIVLRRSARRPGRRPPTSVAAAPGDRREGRLDRRECLLHLVAADAVDQHDRVERPPRRSAPGAPTRPSASASRIGIRHADVHARHPVVGEHLRPRARRLARANGSRRPSGSGKSTRIVASAPPTSPVRSLATARQAPRTKFVNVGCTLRVQGGGASSRAR